MLTRDVRFEGFTTGDWVRLADLFRPPQRTERERLTPRTAQEDSEAVADSHPGASASVRASDPHDGRRHGGVIAVTTGERLRKLLSTRQGRLAVRDEPWPSPPEALAERHGARWVVELQTGALEDLMDRFGDRL
ncbi:MAG TPA: hypothetical protein VK524_30130, partial [Polyangiaceae bacterium]|nr:hypothetical protein [Polyangiaceae bacterium]